MFFKRFILNNFVNNQFFVLYLPTKVQGLQGKIMYYSSFSKEKIQKKHVFS